MSAQSTSKFALDKRNGKLMGVCAGFANWTGINTLAVRLGLVGLTFFVFGPVAVIAYFLIGWLAS